MKKKFKVGLLGATGIVGKTFLRVLHERDFPVSSLFLFASSRSAGQTADFGGEKIIISELTHENVMCGMDVAFFAVDGDLSREYAPVLAKNGCLVVDNSSAWRTDPEVPLVVPEVNGEEAFKHKNIIANPNCSTAQAVVALNPLHLAYGIKRIVYSTYQSVSGATIKGMEDLERTLAGEPHKFFPYPIAGNCIPHIDTFGSDGYTGEETKMIFETKKIMRAPQLKITATTVRVPVFVGHSESINVEFEKPFDIDELKKVLANAPGVTVTDDPSANLYPTPLAAAGSDDVYVGRIRRDASVESGVNLWVVSDNLRKGAATNAVQIAELVLGVNAGSKN
ncbi:MAG: aspartate-semialdehyde dehydrogenase [Defluviitaleaceae bacterium]|nr:aspartate-semialdehyde dehydrogenase [Defluviitaleaceae bacterium]